MNTNSLLASAAINIGLAFVTLSLVSLLKKQPSTASIYYTRPFSHHHQIPLQSPSTSLHRFLPSVGWVFRAFRATEAEILNAHGVDALVIIRLFKFGSVSLRLFHMHFIFFHSYLFLVDVILVT